MVLSLNTLPDHEKPEIVILSGSEESFHKIKETGYPYVGYLTTAFSYSVLERAINKLSRIAIKKNLIEKGYSQQVLPVLFGYYEQLPLYKCERKLFWIPDLQDKHYPHYLGEEVARSRKVQHEKLAYSASEVVFSSQDSKNDFERFYPHSTCKKFVVPFAVTLPDISHLSVSTVLTKFGIDGAFYFSPNQFWQHKNHLVVIKAVEILKQMGKEIKVVFTGNEKTGGNYAQELKDYVCSHGLQENCYFLGFIDRSEQLVLMREAIAVIQPSLFEGWSTVVEDAKCLGKWLILSNLAVHHEQISSNVSFFDPLEAQSLADQLLAFEAYSPQILPLVYNKNVLKFAETMTKLL